MNIIYKRNGKIYSDAVVTEAGLPTDVKYFVVNLNDLPQVPVEVWDLSDDGVVTVNEEKYSAYKRSSAPNLTPREFRKRLRDLGVYTEVNNFISDSDDGYLEDAWLYGDTFSRTDEVLIKLFTELGYTADFVDSIWNI